MSCIAANDKVIKMNTKRTIHCSNVSTRKNDRTWQVEKKSVLFVNEYLFGPDRMQNIYYCVLRVQFAEKLLLVFRRKNDTGCRVIISTGMLYIF